MIKLERSVQIDALLTEIDSLKKKLSSGGNNNQGHALNLRHAQPEDTSTELKVVGQVNAGRLRSASSAAHGGTPVSVSGASSSPGVRQGHPFEEPLKVQQQSGLAVAPASTSAEPLQRITAEEAYEQWQGWVSEVRKTKIGIGTILEESHILDVADGALRIACPDDYHFSSLKRHKEFLIDSFHKATGFKLRIEPVLHSGASNGNGEAVRSAVTSSGAAPVTTTHAQNPGNGNGNEHPVILALRRELGAEPVE
jgi:hypothetical protein